MLRSVTPLDAVEVIHRPFCVRRLEVVEDALGAAGKSVSTSMSCSQTYMVHLKFCALRRPRIVCESFLQPLIKGRSHVVWSVYLAFPMVTATILGETLTRLTPGLCTARCRGALEDLSFEYNAETRPTRKADDAADVPRKEALVSCADMLNLASLHQRPLKARHQGGSAAKPRPRPPCVIGEAPDGRSQARLT